MAARFPACLAGAASFARAIRTTRPLGRRWSSSAATTGSRFTPLSAAMISRLTMLRISSRGFSPTCSNAGRLHLEFAAHLFLHRRLSEAVPELREAIRI